MIKRWEVRSTGPGSPKLMRSIFRFISIVSIIWFLFEVATRLYEDNTFNAETALVVKQVQQQCRYGKKSYEFLVGDIGKSPRPLLYRCSATELPVGKSIAVLVSKDQRKLVLDTFFTKWVTVLFAAVFASFWSFTSWFLPWRGVD